MTSREALHVRGEQLYAVPPLSLPQAGHEPPTAAELAGYEAVQLFVERAQAVRPDFHLTNENSAAIADICLRVDGLPLAIELATARINLFSPEQLRERLGSRLALLARRPARSAVSAADAPRHDRMELPAPGAGRTPALRTAVCLLRRWHRGGRSGRGGTGLADGDGRSTRSTAWLR